MTAVSEAERKLKSGGIAPARQEAEAMFCKAADCSIADIYTESRVLDRAQLDAFNGMISRRINGEPLQYIVGMVNFYGNELLTEPGVFIPRPETEILAEVVLNLLTKYERRDTSCEPLIFDLCTGCGNVAISLTKAETNCRIISSDISQNALSLAEKNARLNGVSGKIRFIRADLFDMPREYTDSFDIIVSNPPYVDIDTMRRLPAEVKKEPQEALYGGIDGLDFYRRIIRGAPVFLKQGGFIALELGDGQSGRVAGLFENSGNFRDIKIFKDLNNIDRVITAKLLTMNHGLPTTN